MSTFGHMKHNPHSRAGFYAGLAAFWLPAFLAGALELQIPADSPGISGPSPDNSIANRLARLPVNEPFHIILQDGLHQFTSPLVLPAGLAGTEKCPIIFE